MASNDFAGRWMFCPPSTRLSDGLCAIYALSVGLYFIKKSQKELHRRALMLAFVFLSAVLIATS